MKQVIKITCDTKDLLAPDKLTPLQGELKSLTEKKYEKLKASLLRHGFVFPEYVWKNGKTNYVTDGHQRLRAIAMMKQQGIELEGGKVPIVYVQADNKKHALELILAAMSEYGSYDEDSVYEFVKTNELDWSEIKPFSDFAALNMGKLDVGWFQPDWTPEAQEKSEEVPERPTHPVSKDGDVWKLSDHVLMCGDCRTASRSVFKKRYSLLVTDPPYGVDYSAKNEFLNTTDNGKRNQTPIVSDSMTSTDMSLFWKETFSEVRKFAEPGASYYVTGPQGGDLLVFLLMALRESGFPLRHCLIWAKNNHVLGRCDYNYKHEPIIFGWVEGTHRFHGYGEVSLWEIPKPQKSDHHPTMKPVELYARAIRNSSKPGEIVADPFAGSGPLVLACEQLDRDARMIEIDPGYCDVIVERWQEFSGKKAKRIRGKQVRPARSRVKS